MIEKAIRKHINKYDRAYPNKSLDEFVTAVLGELGIDEERQELLRKEYSQLMIYADNTYYIIQDSLDSPIPKRSQATEEEMEGIPED